MTGDNMKAILAAVHRSLGDVTNEGRVMLASMRALNVLICQMPRPSDLDQFQCVVEAMMAGLAGATASSIDGRFKESVPLSFVEALIEIAEEQGSFFGPQIGPIFEVIVGLIENSTTVAPLRHMLIELLVTLSERCTKPVRKLKSPTGDPSYFCVRLFGTCVRLVTMLPEEPSWHVSDQVEESSSEYLDSDTGEQAIDRVTQALGLRATYSVMSAMLGTLLSSDNWKLHYAGLRCMGNFMEVSCTMTDKAQVAAHRQEVVATLLSFAKNPHPRVRATTYYAFSQLFRYHGKFLSQEQVDGILAQTLADCSAETTPSPRVRRNVLFSLTNMIDTLPASAIEPRVGQILSSVVQTLNEGPVIVQENCVSVLISLAESIRGERSPLAEHYDALMPILKSLMDYASSRRLETLWGQTLECCAMIGESSGKVKFYPDALQMMNALVELQSQLQDDAEVRKYIMKAWVRIARCLGVEFLPFLQLVLEKLLTAITQDTRAGV
jgi:importin-5